MIKSPLPSMNKLEIEQLLSTQKVSSISDIIYFVIEQVNKTLAYEPIHELHLRISELQRPKGLDSIMIEQVKTIVEAMIEQSQQNLRFDLQKSLNDNLEHIQHMISNINQSTKNPRQSLAEIEILNFLNTNSFNSAIQEDNKKYLTQQQFRRNRQSFKENFSKQLNKDNFMSDCNKLKESLRSDRKQLNEMKYTIMQVNKELSDKITIEQAHRIISEFESRIYQKVQNEKLDLQRLEFKVKKQLQEEILKVRKELSFDFNFQTFRKQVITTKKTAQKLQKKIEKFKEEQKSLVKSHKNLQNTQINLCQELKDQKKQLSNYQKFNNSKNEDLGLILEQINHKLSYFEKIDKLELRINNLSLESVKAQWQTQCRTKNESIVWQKQVYNMCPQLFKFESQKSQILINSTGTFLIEFILFQYKATHLSGSLWIQPCSLQSSKREIKASGNCSLKFVFEIFQKSLVSLKLLGGENSGGVGGKGLIKISKY